MNERFSFPRFCWITCLYVLSASVLILFGHRSEVRTELWLPSGVLLGATLRYGWRYAFAGIPGYLLVDYGLLHWGLPFWMNASISVVSTVNALGSAWLLKRYSETPADRLPRTLREFCDFLFYGVIAVVGITTCAVICLFYSAGIFSFGELGFVALTWMSGTLCGISIATPTFLVLTGSKISLKKRTYFTLPITFAVAITGLFGYYADQYYQGQRQRVANDYLDTVVKNVERDLESLFAVGTGLAKVFEQHEQFSEDELIRFTQIFSGGVAEISEISWLSAIESADDSQYTILSYVETPVSHSRQDTLLEIERKQPTVETSHALLRARDTAASVLVEPVEVGDTVSTLRVYRPVYVTEDPPSRQERIALLKGYIAIDFDLAKLLAHRLDTRALPYHYSIKDRTASGHLVTLAHNMDRTDPADGRFIAAKEEIGIAGRTWHVSLYPLENGLVYQDTAWHKWGLVLLQTAFLLFASGVVVLVYSYGKDLEQRHLDLTHKQATAKALLSALLASAQEGIIVTDSNGKVCQLNPVAKRMLDEPESELVGTSLSRLFDERDQPLVYEALDNEKAPPNQALTLQGPREANTPVALTLHPYNSDGEATAYIATLREVSSDEPALPSV